MNIAKRDNGKWRARYRDACQQWSAAARRLRLYISEQRGRGAHHPLGWRANASVNPIHGGQVLVWR